MSPGALRRRVQMLSARAEVTRRFEGVLSDREIRDGSKVWYSNQRDHWLRWLKDYNGPGYYSRKTWSRSAEFVYNHINCPPMVLWLGEAAGVPKPALRAAVKAALAAGPSFPRMCAAIRRVIPWELVEGHLSTKRRSSR